MKIFSKVSAAVVLSLLVLSGCADVFNMTEQDQLPKEGLVISINGGDNARTIIPATPAFVSYELNFAGPNGAIHDPVTFSGASKTISDLTPGLWTVTASGYVSIGGNAPAVAAVGAGTVNIIQSSLQTLNIEISTGMSGDNGTFSYDVSFPSFVESGELLIYLFGADPDLVPVDQKIDLMTTQSGSISLPPGYYLMTINLEGEKDDGSDEIYKSYGMAEIVHIYSNIETKTPEYTFYESDFAEYNSYEDVGSALGFDWTVAHGKKSKILASITTGGAINMTGTISKDYDYANISDEPYSQTLEDAMKTAAQVKITVKGDGNDYRVSLQTLETANADVDWNHFAYIFTAPTTATTITLNIDDFKQGDWGSKKTYFDIRHADSIQFSREGNGAFNLTVSKIEFVPSTKISLGDFNVNTDPTGQYYNDDWRGWGLNQVINTDSVKGKIADGTLNLLIIAFDAAQVEQRGGLPGMNIIFNYDDGTGDWHEDHESFPWYWNSVTNSGGWITYNDLLNYKNAEFKQGLIYLYYDLTAHPGYDDFITIVDTADWSEIDLYANKEWDATYNHPLLSEFYVNAWLSSAPSDKSRARINVSFKGFANETISLGSIDNLSDSVSENKRIAITVNGTYSSYKWFIDGVEVADNTTNQIIIPNAGLDYGQHTVTAVVVKNGVPYSKVLTFIK